MLKIDQFIDKIGHLPPMPQTLSRLLNLLNEVDADVDEVVELIQFDPSITAQVMRLCNSAFFAGANPAADIREAVSRVGFAQVVQLVTAVTTAAAVKPAQKGYGIQPGELWRHSVTAALAARDIAQDCNAAGPVAFTAALLHDLGKVVLSRALESRYDEVVAEARKETTPMLAVERKILGYDHAEIGGRLLERWNFPAELAEAVRFHHDPGAAPDHRALASFIYLGNLVSCFMGFGCGVQALALSGREDAFRFTGADPEAIPGCMMRTACSLHETEALMNLAN
jgi:putative nucleotidyltransferase with HDIG domain